MKTKYALHMQCISAKEYTLMAEFCLDCWNKINGTNYTEKHYIISKELHLCEGCGEYKHVILAEKFTLRRLFMP